MKRLHLHVTSAVLLAMTRSALRHSSLDSTRHKLDRIAKLARVRAQPNAIAHAVTSAARRLPWSSTCLHEALAGEALMRAAGHDCELRIGARKDQGTHAFHAWLEWQQIAVIGATDVEHTVLTRRLP